MKALSRSVWIGALALGSACVGIGAAAAVECNPVVQRNVVKTNTDVVTRSATGFATVPGATVAVIVPQGPNACVKVRFGADANSSGPGIVRLVAISSSATLRLNPIDDGLVYVTGAGGRGAHDYEWVRNLGPGNYTIAVQWRVRDSGTSFTLHNWTMDVEVR